MSVEFVNADVVHMDKHTFMWVQQTHFTFDAACDDGAVLAELIACDAYDHDYASPFESNPHYASPFPSSPQPPNDQIHGRWRLDAVNVERFHPISSDAAVSVIDKWANEQEWLDSDYRQPDDVMARLEPVYELLRSGSVLQLDNPGDDALHDYGWVTGKMGFHEFVVLDRSSGSLHVIVASDD